MPQPELVVAYGHDGPAPPAPQVLVVHALTGSTDAAGDWWAPLIAPGSALDTRVDGVLRSSLLGGRLVDRLPNSRSATEDCPC